MLNTDKTSTFLSIQWEKCWNFSFTFAAYSQSDLMWLRKTEKWVILQFSGNYNKKNLKKNHMHFLLTTLVILALNQNLKRDTELILSKC